MPVFAYGTKETTWLSQRDSLLGEAIRHIGHIERTTEPDPFRGLVWTIAGQQVSSKAQASVWKKLCDTLGIFSPADILQAGEAVLRGCGLSSRKATAIVEAARKAVDENFFDMLSTMDTEQTVAYLTTLKGIGRWSAEMLLIFSLERPNILSLSDFGIRKGICLLYHKQAVTPAFAQELQKRYSPFATTASFYLWEIASSNYSPT